MTLLLDAREVEQVLTMADAVPAMEEAFRDLASGAGVNRPRSHTSVPRPSPPGEQRFYLFKSMDGALPRLGRQGIRMSSDLIVERSARLGASTAVRRRIQPCTSEICERRNLVEAEMRKEDRAVDREARR
ncbi:MAG: hypothetical protein HYU37_22235 [Acidobacteria bacterium]|nr:hypothetical protein [Acidobacteriota bacterium]